MASDSAAPPGIAACQFLDGRPGIILAASAPGGAAAASLVRVQTWQGAHAASCVEDTRLSFNLTGTGRAACDYTAAGRRVTHSSAPGAFYLAPPGLDFGAVMGADAEMLTVDLPTELMSLARGELEGHAGGIIERVGLPDPSLLALATALGRELACGLPGGPVYWTELSDTIALAILRRHATQPVPLRTGLLPAAAIRKVNALIHDTMAEPITLDDLARAAGHGRFRFLRAFTRTLGMTPSRYLMHRRLRTAVAMARRGRDSLATIAYATGFADQSHLTRWCRRVYGIRPSEIRLG